MAGFAGGLVVEELLLPAPDTPPAALPSVLVVLTNDQIGVKLQILYIFLIFYHHLYILKYLLIILEIDLLDFFRESERFLFCTFKMFRRTKPTALLPLIAQCNNR